MAIFRRRRSNDDYSERAFLEAASQRAPQASTTVVGMGTYGGSGFTGTYTGTGSHRSAYNAYRSTTEHYLCNTWLYAAIRALGEDLASLTFRVGADPDKAQNFNAKAPLALALGPAGKPNPQTTAHQLWMWTVGQWIINGRFAWEVDPTARPLTYWPLVSQRLQAVPTSGGEQYFKGFKYDIGQGQEKSLNADRVVYHWRPSQLDWRVPESQLQSARLDIDIAVMQDIYEVAFLRNDARPAAIIIHEAIENDDERDAFRRQFLDTHRGARNAGKVAFAEVSEDGAPAKDALVVQTIGLSQKESKAIERYESKVSAMLVAVGVPRTRLGDATSKTFANAEEEIKMYWRNTVRQLAVELATAINQYVAPKYGSDVCWFDFSENPYLSEPPKFSIADGLAAVKLGVISVEECRVEAMGLPEAPEMGELVAPVAPPAAIAAPPSPTALPTGSGTTETPLPVAAGDVLAEFRALVASLREPVPLPPPVIEVTEHIETAEEARERRSRQWRSFASQTSPLEKRWQRRVQRMFDAQLESVLARLNGKRGRQALKRDGEDDAVEVDVDAVFDPVFWKQRAHELGLDLHEDASLAAFKAFEASVGIAFDVDAPFAKKYILARANQLAGQVTQTTYDGIKKQLVEGAGQGESIPDLADRIRGLFEQTYANRAETVARTEVISGYNGSTTQAAAQTDGVVKAMEWISTDDDRTRGSSDKDEFDHVDADGQTVDVGDSFDVSGELLAYPGDPAGSPGNVINCRCTTAPVVDEEAGNRTGQVVPIDRVARLAMAIHRGECRVTEPRRAVRALR